MTDGLKAKYRAAIIDILAANERVERAVLFGSRAMETFTPTSDVDIALFGNNLTLTDQANLATAIDELPMAQRVDLLLHKTVDNDALRKHIEQHGVEWYRRQAREKMTGSPWKRMPLGDFVTLQRGHDLPDAIRRPGNKPVLGSFGVTGWHDEARAAGPGVTVGRSGASFGVVSYSPVDYWPLNTALYVVDFHGNDQRFAYYFLKQVDFRTYNSGSAQPSLNRNFIHPIPVDIPPLPEQHTIAHILGTLDDKIELNRRMNETLEEMARALFKSWFIDFDPVHAKAALKRHAAAQITPPLRGSRQAKGDSPQASRWGDHAATHPPRRWAEIKRQYSPQTLQRAQALRQNQTNAEGLLWHYLSRKQLAGYRFRRQQPIGPYIADFACLSEKLLIELDGGQHAERTASDNRRDRFLQEKGYRVLRFWNHEVFENCFGVLESIHAALPHHPPLEGGSKDGSLSGRGSPPPPQPAPDGLASATPPPGGSDWSVERARSYLDGMDPSIAAMFPDRFVDSELGEIPEGWGVGKLEDMVDQLRDKENPLTSPSTPFSHFSIPAYDGGQTPKQELGGSIKSTKTRVQPGVVLLSKLNPEIERVWLVDVSPDDQAVCSTEFLVLRAKPPFHRSYVYCLLRTPLFRQQIQSLVTGTSKSHQRAPAEAILDLPMVLPSGTLIDSFEKVAENFLSRTMKCRSESRALVALRDTLLPKLISGKLRVGV